MKASGNMCGKTIPHLAGGMPVIGHAIEFRRNPVALIQRGRDLHGDLFTVSLFGRRVHVLPESLVTFRLERPLVLREPRG